VHSERQRERDPSHGEKAAHEHEEARPGWVHACLSTRHKIDCITRTEQSVDVRLNVR
jgi:hypothetical protein